MKIKFNILATASALALASSMASAAINVSSTPDLLLIAYDFATASTYVRDLGVSLSALNTSQVFNAPAGSIFTTQFAGVAPGNIQWNVVALSNTVDSQANFTGATYQTGDLTSASGNGPNSSASQAGLLTSQLGSFTQLDLAANGYAKANGEYTGVKALGDTTNAAYISNLFGYGSNNSGNGVGSSQNFTKNDATGNASQLFVNASLAAFGDGSDAAGGYFTLTDAQGDLTWTNGSAVAAVPLPAAVLLFAPGLLAMVGLGRRRQNRGA